MAARRDRIVWLPVAVWSAVIAVASLSPGVGAPSGAGALLHGFAYLVLAWLIRRAFAGTSSSIAPVKAWMVAAGLAWGFGLVIEGLQSTLEYRSAEIHDLAANGVGALLGALGPARRRAGSV